MRHVDGRAVYLTEASVSVFEAERRRTADEERWAADRKRWLEHARAVGAPRDRRAKLAAAPLGEATVLACRQLYLSTAERAAHRAGRARRWNDVARIRRRQASALYHEAGSPIPPPDEVVALYRQGVTATLHSLAELGSVADLVGARCCPACRADNGRTFRVADELRTPRLPHAGCPRGLCDCDWWIVTEAPKRRRRRRPSPPSARRGDDPPLEATPAASY